LKGPAQGRPAQGRPAQRRPAQRRPAQTRRNTARRPTPLAKIELVLLDVDGVLTDGRLFFSARGEAQKVFHVRDGHGIKLLMKSGVAVAVVSGRRSAAVTARMRELGVAHLVQGCADKVETLRELAKRLGVDPLACACLVDDTPDLPLMTAVGFAAAVADAHPLVLSAAHWVSALPGGAGAVRELADRLLRARAARTV
jgi:3-deoxy-D-manno-octulosonate 8-phosphate phosphatase (KDO 8-P phosphatase)